MRPRPFLAATLALLCLAGCQTTQETTAVLNQSWVGASADTFFVRNGAPVSRFKLANGGTIYGWRGGERSITITETIREEDPFEDFWARGDRSGRYRDPFPEFRNERIVSRRETVVCEADIATDARNRIVNITIRKDTRGVGLAPSRCSEIFPNT